MIKLRESIKNRKIYGNYSVYSPDNILMFRSNIKKINWYLSRNLAEKIDDYSIRLTFNPNGLGCHGLDYGLEKMQNICVVCGTNQFLTKHHVVPRCYRIHFSEEIKSHRFHDVLTVCLDCHFTYEELAFEYKKKLSEIYNVPINGDLINNKKLQKIQGLFLCLDKEEIPDKRKEEIRKEIKEELGVKRISNQLKKKWISQNTPPPIICTKTHGEMVIEKINSIDQFIKNWRIHFIENTNPKFLPKSWSIDHG